MGFAKSGTLGGSEGQVEAEWHQPLGRSAAAAVHRARNRRQTRGAAPGRAGVGSRPDLHGPYRGTRARVEERLYDRDRHSQHAASGACLGLHGVYVSRRNGGIRRDRRGFHQAEEERDGGLHYRPVRLNRSNAMGSEHLSKQYDTDLETLRSGVLQMGGLVESQIRQALDAFARLDAADAASIIRQDVAIDTEFRSILRQLITFMMEDPRTISTALEIVWIAKAI